jgi:nucleotide-binding universal stress UspA family protein
VKILICSDGHASAENAIRFIAQIAAACSADVTLLGIVEHPGDQSNLTEALARGAQLLRDVGVQVEIVMGQGHPIAQIKQRTLERSYDLVAVGAERKAGGPFALSTKAYHIIKGIDPPVLVMIGKRAELRRILVCSSGELPLDRTIALTAAIARGARAAVTLLHVLAAPPLIYSDLLERQISGVDKLLASNFALARNLRHEKAAFEKLEAPVEVKLRSGDIADELLREARARDFDLIVTGSAPTGGAIGAYLMGDVTAAIVDGSDCPVLVVRNTHPKARNRYLTSLRRLFGAVKSKLKG